jgi:hypothetical protein
MRDFINLVENLLAEELPTPNHLVDAKAVFNLVYNDMDWSTEAGGAASVKYAYAREHEIEINHDNFDGSDTSAVDTNTPEFTHWFKGWVEERLWDAWGNFAHLFDASGNATLYRVITAPADWKPDARHPGIYWSWDKNAADAHWGDFSEGNVKWRIAAEVNMSVVDWTTTLAMNIMPDYEDEKEIRIRENSPVNIIGVEQIR